MITHVAIKDKDGKVWSLPKPNRHHNIVHLLHLEKPREEALKLLGNHVQGFLNDKGVFKERRQAWAEALKCGQILPPYDPINPSKRLESWDWTKHPVKELFSEDLW